MAGEEEFKVPIAQAGIIESADDDTYEMMIRLEDEVGGRRTYRFHSDAELGRGSFGRVFLSTNGQYVIKLLNSFEAKPRLTERLKKAFEAEVMLQLLIRANVPEACPAILDYGILPTSGNKRFVVMEKMTASARSFLTDRTHPREVRDQFALECLRQTAEILKRLEPFQFNHRDLKSDNIMYTLGEDDLPVFKLIDFGFACATFDGKRYEGVSYFNPGIHCFRRSRDLAFLILELHLYFHSFFSQSLNTFFRLLLTFKFPDGSECKMYNGCNGLAKWEDSYRFLDKDEVENPHTTPEGLLHAIEVYERRGLEACRAGFVLDPVAEACVAAPPEEEAKVESPGKVPQPIGEHVLSPNGGKRRKTQKRHHRPRRFKHTRKA